MTDRFRLFRYRRQCSGSSAGLTAALVIMLIAAVPSFAEHTRFWRQSDYEEFDKGTANGLALRSDGKLVLAPKVVPFGDANLAYLWALRTDSHGTLYGAGGSNAKVVKFDAVGKATTVFEAQEMSAQALAFDKRDNLYVGTSPDGKVYKVTPDGQRSVFYDPKTKYIWDLAIGPDGILYVATGDTGKIFAVTPDGNGSLFYGSEETHIRTLAFDGKGNLLAGTEPNGLLLRIPLAADAAPDPAAKRDSGKRNSAKGKPGDTAKTETSPAENSRHAYVIYETSKKEITSIVPDGSGNIYIAAIGEKTRPTPGFPQPQNPNQPQQNGVNATGNITVTVNAVNPAPQAAPTPSPFAPFPTLSFASVYRIAPDGSPEELWSARDDLVYSMALSAGGKLLFGIGNQGAVMELDGNRIFSRLAKTESEQVTGFALAQNGKMYVATANPGKVLALGPELESQGSFESQTYDAHIFSRWGRLAWFGDNTNSSDGGARQAKQIGQDETDASPSGVDLYVRTGNTSEPGNNWSDWAGPYRNAKGQQISSPAARFVQWKAVLNGGNGSEPELSWVELAYLAKNIAPRVEAIAIQNPGVRITGFGNQSQGQPVPVQLHAPAESGTQGSAGALQRATVEPSHYEPPPQGFAQKGYEAVLWTAQDPNDDDLTYSIYYRGEREKTWRLLKDKIEQKYYSWDTTSMPDGAYYLKIVASDEKSNPPDQALTADLESDRFVIDNTPPEVSGIAAEPAAAPAPGDPAVTIHFRASDPASPIVRAQYSLDAGEWTLALPEGGLSDAPDETYSITLRGITPGEHTVSVRVYDQFENQSAAKVTFTVPAGKH